MFGFKRRSEALSEDFGQFPTLLMEPWRVQELVETESSLQRHHLFQMISWTRLVSAIVISITFLLISNHTASVLTGMIYTIAVAILLIKSNQSQQAIPLFSFITALLDIAVLAYILNVSDSRTGLGFVFFSILLSAMLLALPQLLLIVVLAVIIILATWSQTDATIIEKILNFKITNFDITTFLSPDNWDELIVLVVGLFIIAIITNTLTRWSFTNEVKAQFRYKQLRQVLSFNRTVIEYLKSGVLVLNSKGEVISINRRAAELLNLNDSQAVTTLQGLSADLFRQYRQWLITEGPSNHFTYRHNLGAEEIFVSFSSFGESHQKRIVMMTLESVNSTLQQTQEAKLTSLGRLTAGVAHEIRNPLSSINSAAQLLAESSEQPQHQKLSEMILKNVNRTNRIINDILGLFKDAKSEKNLLPIREILKNFCREFLQSNKDEKFKLQITSKIDKALFFMFDEGQFEQILWNLVQNSLKYANVEKLIITLRYSLSSNNKALFIDIIDNGQGIPDDKAKHIFEPFYTGGAASSGLGLYLVRELCDANGANISYINMSKQSKEKQGACFRITTPVYFSQNIKPQIN